MEVHDFVGYDFKKNHNKDSSYTQILEWLSKQTTKGLIDESYDDLDAGWGLEIPIDLT